MKKLVLIIGIVLCIAVIGSVFALAIYDASPAEGTIGADTSVYLTLKNNETTTGFTLEKGVPTVIGLTISIEQNDSSWGTATLTVVAKAQDGMDISKVTITMWANQACTTPLDTNNTVDGTWTKTGITASQLAYIKIEIAEDATQQDIGKIGGQLTLTLKRVAA